MKPKFKLVQGIAGSKDRPFMWMANWPDLNSVGWSAHEQHPNESESPTVDYVVAVFKLKNLR